MRMSRRAVLLLGVFLAGAAGNTVAQESAEAPPAPQRKAFRESFRPFAADGRYLVTFPARTNAKGLGLRAATGAAMAVAMKGDGGIHDRVVESDSAGAGRAARKFEPLGRSEIEATALGALYCMGRGAKNERLVATTGTAFDAYLWSMIIASVMKGAFGRERPGRGSGNGEFFARDSIFPSGHTTRSFAIAAVFADHYGRKTALVAYPLAALIGLSTVQEDKHWLSDVVAGAGLGLAIGRGVAPRPPPTQAPGGGGAAGPGGGAAGAPGGAGPAARLLGRPRAPPPPAP